MRFGDNIAKGFSDAIAASGKYRVEAIRAMSSTESLTNAIRKQDLTAGQLVKRHKQLNDVVKEQWRLRNAMAMSWSTDARGRVTADMIIPNDVPERVGNLRKTVEAARKGQISFAQASEEARMKLGLYSQAMQSAALNTVNWGKNMQWAGRQLMVGLTLPFVAFGAVAAMTANTVDKELTRIVKVYDLTSASMTEINGRQITEAQRVMEMERESANVREQSMRTAIQSAEAYGSKIEDTLQITSELAASGQTGAKLQATTNVVNRAALLGELDRQDALKATISLQNVYGMSVQQLGDAFNYMNSLENATSLQMQDMVVAIPRLSGVVKSLGGDLQDIGTLMVAAKVGGIDAAEAANALKSVLFRANAPSGGYNEKTFIEATGTSLEELRKQAGGDGIRLITEIGKKMQAIPDPSKRIAILREIFGIYQGSKAGIIMEQLAKNTDQVARSTEIAGQSVVEWGTTADRELKKIQESASGRFQIAIQSMRAQLAGLGEPFLEVGIMIVNAISGILKAVNMIPDSVKKMGFLALAAIAIIGPVTMLTGLFANLIGTVFKASATFSLVASRMRGLSQDEAAEILVNKNLATTFASTTGQAMVMANSLKNLTNTVNELAQAQRAAAATQMNPANRTFAASTMMPASEQAKNVLYREQLNLQKQVAQGLITEAEMQEQLTMLKNSSNNYDRQKQILQNQFRAGLITESELSQSLIANDMRHNTLVRTRNQLQGQVRAGLITEMEMRQSMLAAENTMLNLTTRRVAAERAAAAGSSADAAQKVGEQAGKAATGGIATGVAGIAMMVSTMGILSSETGEWVNTLAMGVFLLSGTLVVAKAIKATQTATAAVTGVLAIKTAFLAGGFASASVAAKAMALSVASTLGPIAVLAAGITAIAGSFLYLKRNNEEVEESIESWSGTSERVGKQIGADLSEGFAVAAGGGENLANKVGETMSAAATWAKENPVSLAIVSDTDNMEAAAAEVQRIGIDVFQATGDAKKAREAMMLAINGSGNKGLTAKVNLELNMGNIRSQMTANSTALLEDLTNDTRGSLEMLYDDLTNFSLPWPFGSGTGKDGPEDIGLGNEALGKAREMGKQIADAYTGGSLQMFQARAKAQEAALDAQVQKVIDADKIMQALADNAKDRKILAGVGIDASDEGAVRRFLLQYDQYEGKVDGLSNTMQRAASKTLGARQAEQAMIQTLEDSGVLHDDAAVASGNLSRANGILEGALKETTAQMETTEVAAEELAEAQEDAAASATKMMDAYKQSMTNVAGSIFEEADRLRDAANEAELDGIENASEQRMDRIEASAENRMKGFEAQQKAMDADYKRRNDELERNQKARRKAEESVFDSRIEAIEATVEAEEKADEAREKMFDAERQRIQRRADMFNQNVDFNVALNTGNLDEAAKLANNMRGTQMGWALDDAEANSGSALEAKKAKADAEIEAIENEKTARMEALDLIDEAEDAALNRAKERDKEALDNAKEAYQTDVDNARKAETEKTKNATDGARKRHEAAKRALDMELAALKTFVPKNQAELNQHINNVQGAYAKHGFKLDTTSKEWASFVSRAMTSATLAAEAELANAQKWDAIGATIGGSLAQSMLGMTFPQFIQWMTDGTLPATAVAANPTVREAERASSAEAVRLSNMTPTQRAAQDGYGGGITRHGGGPINSMDKYNNRAGRPASAGLYSDEVPVIAQRGEFMIQKEAVERIGLNNLMAMNAGATGPDPTGRMHQGGLVGGVGALAAALLKKGIDRAMYIGAKRRVSEGSQVPSQLAHVLKANGEQGVLNAGAAAGGLAGGEFAAGGKWPAAIRGVISANTRAAQNFIRDRWASSRNGGDASLNRADPSSDHGRGKALDIFPGTAFGKYASGMGLAQGNEIARHLVANPNQFGTKYVIWQKQINSGTGWRPYTRYGDNPGPTLGHYDHVHASFRHQGGLIGEGDGRNTPLPGLERVTTKFPAPSTLTAGLRNGGFTLNEGYTKLHKAEAVLTAPLTESLKRGIDNLDAGGTNQYNISMDFRGAVIRDDVDIEGAVERVLNKKESRVGRPRTIK